MKKAFLCFHLPIANKSFDLWIPNDMSVHEVARLAQKMLQEQESRFYLAGNTTSLYLKDSGEELEANKYIGEFEFIDGTELILA